MKSCRIDICNSNIYAFATPVQSVNAGIGFTQKVYEGGNIVKFTVPSNTQFFLVDNNSTYTYFQISGPNIPVKYDQSTVEDNDVMTPGINVVWAGGIGGTQNYVFGPWHDGSSTFNGFYLTPDISDDSEILH